MCGGNHSIILFFYLFLHFPGKSGGKKMHLNWYVLASLQHLENGEASGWRHMETQAWLLSLPYRAGAERSDQETAGRKGQRQQRAVGKPAALGLGALSSICDLPLLSCRILGKLLTLSLNFIFVIYKVVILHSL